MITIDDDDDEEEDEDEDEQEEEEEEEVEDAGELKRGRVRREIVASKQEKHAGRP